MAFGHREYAEERVDGRRWPHRVSPIGKLAYHDPGAAAYLKLNRLASSWSIALPVRCY